MSKPWLQESFQRVELRSENNFKVLGANISLSIKTLISFLQVSLQQEYNFKHFKNPLVLFEFDEWIMMSKDLFKLE